MNSVRSVRFFSNTAGLLAKNHYDSLGITSIATQGDVKAAYYKLSMLYHPDKNEGCETSATKFRDITEAYEVLGNVRLRKLYDKGVSHIGTNFRSTEMYDEPTSKFYKSREQRARPPMTGRTPIYDFDEWSKAHYGATFAKDMARKRKTEFNRNLELERSQDVKTVHILIVTGILLGTITYLSYDARKGYDDVMILNDTAIQSTITTKVD